MTEKPNSVCKHKTREEAMACPKYRRLVDVPDLAAEYFHGSEHFEPVGEPAEPSASPQRCELCGNLMPGVHRELCERAPQSVAGEGPQEVHCQECHEVVTFNGSYNQWFHDDGTSTYPKCTKPKKGTPKLEEIAEKQLSALTEFAGWYPTGDRRTKTLEILAAILRPFITPAAPVIPGSLHDIWDDLVRLEGIVESHDHQEFESCEVCGERGQFRIAKSRYEVEAIRYVDSLMRQLTPDKPDLDEREQQAVEAIAMSWQQELEDISALLPEVDLSAPIQSLSERVKAHIDRLATPASTGEANGCQHIPEYLSEVGNTYCKVCKVWLWAGQQGQGTAPTSVPQAEPGRKIYGEDFAANLKRADAAQAEPKGETT